LYAAPGHLTLSDIRWLTTGSLIVGRRAVRAGTGTRESPTKTLMALGFWMKTSSTSDSVTLELYHVILVTRTTLSSDVDAQGMWN
jgi:hypothetical protein